VLGPPPTSGTRDAFVELAMEAGCKEFAWIKAMAESDETKFKRTATNHAAFVPLLYGDEKLIGGKPHTDKQ
jgi:hypothetical protein